MIFQIVMCLKESKLFAGYCNDIYESINKNEHKNNHNSFMQTSQTDVSCISSKIKNEQLCAIIFYQIIEK